MSTRSVFSFKSSESTNLLEDDDLVGRLQVLKLVGDQDTTLVLQQAADTPEDTQTQYTH